MLGVDWRSMLCAAEFLSVYQWTRHSVIDAMSFDDFGVEKATMLPPDFNPCTMEFPDIDVTTPEQRKLFNELKAGYSKETACTSYMTLISLLKLQLYEGLINVSIDVTKPDNPVSDVLKDFQTQMMNDPNPVISRESMYGIKLGQIDALTYEALVETAKQRAWPVIAKGERGERVARLFVLLRSTGCIPLTVSIKDRFLATDRERVMKDHPNDWFSILVANLEYDDFMTVAVQQFEKKWMGGVGDSIGGTQVGFKMWRMLHDPAKVQLLPLDVGIADYEKAAVQTFINDTYPYVEKVAGYVVKQAADKAAQAASGLFSGMLANAKTMLKEHYFISAGIVLLSYFLTQQNYGGGRSRYKSGAGSRGRRQSDEYDYMLVPVRRADGRRLA